MKTDCTVQGSRLYFIPIKTRVPLKFGAETLDSVVLARTEITVRGEDGRTAAGWGETPLSAQWAWPSDLPVTRRTELMQELCVAIARKIGDVDRSGHPVEIGREILEKFLPGVVSELNGNLNDDEQVPHLAGLICCSLFDVAIHDAYGVLNGIDIYKTYNAEFMKGDLSEYLEPAEAAAVDFSGCFPADYLEFPKVSTMRAWHLVGGKDPVNPNELTGGEPNDGYPVLLEEWIERDGLTCLKVKLRGNDESWDYERLVGVGELALRTNVDWLSTDFNCTVTDPKYVNSILDKLRDTNPRIYGAVLYVEQPFPYDLEDNRIDVHSVSARKPLFMDESAHDWRMIRLGRALGWTGVALKTCKTQTGALLSLCWAKAHGMTLMVQDLTNPTLAQIPHVRLAHHAGTIMGVETNSMQFYPEASLTEEAVHPGIYKRTKGQVDLSTIEGAGFGYRVDEIGRSLPDPVVDTRNG